jgi:hypothetical protein
VRYFPYAVALALVLTTACKKEVEKIVVQEVAKTYSWAPASRLYGTNSIVVQMSKNDEALLLQAPYFLNIVSPNPASASYKRFGYVSTLAAYFPGDIYQRLPISRDFIAQPAIAQPAQDTLVELLRPTEAVTTSYKAYVHLRQLDPQATGIIWPDGINHQPFGAISRDNFLLFGYHTVANTDIRLVLTKVSLNAGAQLQAQSRVLTLATLPGFTYMPIRWIQAIDDYFLVNCGDAGLYKIKEDGTAKRVYTPGVADACYKWQGTVYIVEEYNSLLLSKDDGETWQRATGTPDLFNFTTYHVVGDSLIGVTHQLVSQLFTLRWRGAQYSIRPLKSDGLGLAEVRGLEQLGDTVYVGTTGGLFKRPVRQFFDSK